MSVSQNIVKNEQLEVRFLKDHVEIIPGKSFFNILLIENKGSKEITLNVQYNTPKGWGIIGITHEQITLQSLESISLPVRVAVSKNAKGGIGYAIVAIVSNQKGVILNSEYSFIKVPVKSKVKVRTKKKSYYLDHKSLSSSFSIDVENLGNVNEVVNIELIPGNSVLVEGELNDERIIKDYNVETNKSKIITYNIRLKKGIDVEKFKLHKIKAIIKTTDSVINKTIWFKYLDWKYDNYITNMSSPLNVDVNAFNILSDSKPSYRVRMFGKLLLKKNKDLRYSFENIRKDNTNNLWVNSRVELELNSKRTSIFLGDYQGSIGQSMYGRGISITQSFFNKDYVTLVASKRLLSGTENFGAIYSHSFKSPLTLELGESFSNNIKNSEKSYLSYANIITTIFKKHRLNMFFAGSDASYVYNNIINKKNGWGYRFEYSSHIKELDLRLSSYYSSPTYSGINSGRFNTQARASYKLAKSKQLIFSYITREFKPIYYIDNIAYDDKFSKSNKLTIRYNTLFKNKISIFAGPIFIQQATNNFFSIAPGDQFATKSAKFEVGLRFFEGYTGNSFSFSGKYGITNVYDFSTELNGVLVAGNTDKLFYPIIELSSSVKRKNFNIYIKYFHGPYNITQQFAYFYSFFYTKSLNIIPSYERFIYKKSLKLIIRGSYINNLAYKSNRINVNTGLYWYAKKGWKIRFLNSTSYQKINDGSSYNTSQTSTYFEFGISKRFDIQQPRLKFYDFEAVYYKDLNGNRVHDANEPGVASVLTDIQRKDPVADGIDENYNGEFLSNELLSNSGGEIDYLSMPEGEYTVKFSPQDANVGVFGTESVQKTFSINSDTVIHIPFVEKNKLFGKVSLNRTKHSALGNIPIDNIKVTVEGNSKTYSALTDKDGYFELYIPVSDYYKVKINNIFHEHFKLRQDYYIVKFNGYKQFEVSFDFDEKERKIAFDESDFLITDEDLEDNNFSFDDIKVIKQTNLKGEIKDANSLVPLHATVSIHNISTNQLISETASSKRTGVYFTSFFAGDDYNIKASAHGYWVYKEDLNINQITTFENITKDILLNKIFLGEEIKTDNLKFESESAELSPLAKAELDNILALLFLNPTVHIEILGHADNLESLITDALKLSKTRASSVASYLVKHGLREERIKIKGLGSSDPKSFEDTNSGRQRNRLVEIKVTAF